MSSSRKRGGVSLPSMSGGLHGEGESNKKPKRKEAPQPASLSLTGAPNNWWLMKTEPDEFSVEHLIAKETAHWEGVRGGEAKKNMKKMIQGDQIFLYYSSCKIPRVVAVAEVVKEA